MEPNQPGVSDPWSQANGAVDRLKSRRWHHKKDVVKNSIWFRQDSRDVFLDKALSRCLQMMCCRLRQGAEREGFLALAETVFISVCLCAGMRQGNDIGTTYRSVIYTYTEKQLQEALASKDQFQKVCPSTQLSFFLSFPNKHLSPLSLHSSASLSSF